MSIVLHLGVTDIRYQETPATPKGQLPRGGVRLKRPKITSPPSNKTTGDVAEILERKYSLFSMFTVLHGADIEDAVAEAMQGRLESIMMGGPMTDRLLTDADLGEIEQTFKKSIDDREYDGRLPGVPTRAALNGVNHRLKHPYSKGNPDRPSFIDTGAMQASFKAWVD